MAYDHINAKGITYYLNAKRVTLRGGHEQQIFYFSRDVRDTAVIELPAGFEVVENKNTGLPILKRLAKVSASS